MGQICSSHLHVAERSIFLITCRICRSTVWSKSLPTLLSRSCTWRTQIVHVSRKSISGQWPLLLQSHRPAGATPTVELVHWPSSSEADKWPRCRQHKRAKRRRGRFEKWSTFCRGTLGRYTHDVLRCCETSRFKTSGPLRKVANAP